MGKILTIEEMKDIAKSRGGKCLSEIYTNKDTKLEKAPSLNDIKKGDWADITYTVNDTKNIAKSISIEKDEESAGTPAGTSATE